MNFYLPFACLGFLSPANRGALMTCAMVLFVCLGTTAGYVSARMYILNLFYNIIQKLSQRIDHLTSLEIEKSLKLCSKILSKVQPAVSSNTNTEITENENKKKVNIKATTATKTVESELSTVPLEKSQSDSKLNKQESEIISFNDRSPSPRRRANSSGPTKKTDKKSKKKSSKSTSKLSDSASIQSNSSNV